MTYLALQIRRDIIAAEIRAATARNRAALPALYAEAKSLAMESLKMEAAR